MNELDLLKQRADVMGIKYSPNIGVDALKAKIAEGTKNTKEEPVNTAMSIRSKLLAEELKQVRIRISVLNPDKSDLPGEIYTVANRYIGTVRKYVPFGERTDNGWHVPNIIYKHLKSRKFVQKKLVKHKNGHTEVVTHDVPEFTIEVLPPLTKEELEEMKVTQAAIRD